jgi:hypothetical protein
MKTRRRREGVGAAANKIARNELDAEGCEGKEGKERGGEGVFCVPPHFSGPHTLPTSIRTTPHTPHHHTFTTAAHTTHTTHTTHTLHTLPSYPDRSFCSATAAKAARS